VRVRSPRRVLQQVVLHNPPAGDTDRPAPAARAVTAPLPVRTATADAPARADSWASVTISAGSTTDHHDMLDAVGYPSLDLSDSSEVRRLAQQQCLPRGTPMAA
jgi:hypothetical protein